MYCLIHTNIQPRSAFNKSDACIPYRSAPVPN
jgi:hypothetical protein